MPEESKNIKERGLRSKSLSLEGKDRLVGAFVWLIKEDKKQNPELYQLKKQQND